MRATLGEVRQLVAEALKRADAERVAQAIQTAAGKAGVKVHVTVDTYGQLFNVFATLVSGDPAAAEEIMSARADQEGWSLLSKNDRGRGLVFWFEPKAETKGPLSASKLPVVLWHTTLASNVNDILKKGLEPRTRAAGYSQTSRRYAPRVYFGTSENGAKATVNRPGDWKMLRVDRAKLPKQTKFYVDQEFGFRKDGMPVAVYTLDPVPAEAISS